MSEGRKSTHPSFTAMERAAIKAFLRYHPRLADYAGKKNYLAVAVREIVLERLQKEGLIEPPPISQITGARVRSSSTSPRKKQAE